MGRIRRPCGPVCSRSCSNSSLTSPVSFPWPTATSPRGRPSNEPTKRTAPLLRTDLDGITAELASQTLKLDSIAQQIDRNRTELASHTSQLQTVTQQLKRLQLLAIASALLSALLLLSMLALLFFRKP